MSPITIQVVYALPDQQCVETVVCDELTTIKRVIEMSDILAKFPDIVLQDGMVGIWGYRQDLDWEVKDGDRIEIYRSLLLSPTEARRLRAARKAN